MTFDEEMMERCITLARNGTGYVSPNPLVGCVIVKDGKIISEGFHHTYGEAHAERDAIEKGKAKNADLEGATLYVNLEPCSHIGKTGPCADLIIRNKIAKVIIGIKDPYEKVNGNGISKLLENNIKVEIGILDEKCTELNKFFIKYVTKGLPFVTLKVAQSIDGKIALNNFESKWISGASSRKYVRELRDSHDSVLIGYNTALKDDPSLTTDLEEGRTPYRLIIDDMLALPDELKIFNDEDRDKTIVFTKTLKKHSKVQTINLKGDSDLTDVLKVLHDSGINSVLVEGGTGVFSDFIKQDLADELLVFIAPKIIGSGKTMSDHLQIDSLTQAKKLRLKNTLQFDEDILLNYKFIR